jgi:hypothetical protein
MEGAGEGAGEAGAKVIASEGTIGWVVTWGGIKWRWVARCTKCRGAKRGCATCVVGFVKRVDVPGASVVASDAESNPRAVASGATRHSKRKRVAPLKLQKS